MAGPPLAQLHQGLGEPEGDFHGELSGHIHVSWESQGPQELSAEAR
jgi:hypothetical protein